VEDLIIEYQWTRSEYYRAIRKAARVTPFQAAYIIIAAVLTIFFHVFLFVVILCVVAWAFAAYVLRPRTLWNKTPGITDPRRVIFNDDGITTTSPSKTATVAWSQFSRSRETPDYYHIFSMRSPVASPFRKAVFVNSLDEARLRSLLRSHTKASLLPNGALDNLATGNGD
jgi:hypothetical protein